jgi:hypothetical protein
MRGSLHLAGLTLIAVQALFAGSDAGLAKDGGPVLAPGLCRRAAGPAQSASRQAWAHTGADATQHRDPPPTTPSASDSVLRAPRESDEPDGGAVPVAFSNPLRGGGPALDAAAGPRTTGRGPAIPIGRYRPRVALPSRPLGPSPVAHPRLTWVSIPLPPRSPPT